MLANRTPGGDRQQDRSNDDGHRDDTIRKLDQAVELHGWCRLALAERPVGAAKTRVRDAHEGARDDVDVDRAKRDQHESTIGGEARQAIKKASHTLSIA